MGLVLRRKDAVKGNPPFGDFVVGTKKKEGQEMSPLREIAKGSACSPGETRGGAGPVFGETGKKKGDRGTDFTETRQGGVFREEDGEGEARPRGGLVTRKKLPTEEVSRQEKRRSGQEGRIAVGERVGKEPRPF